MSDLFLKLLNMSITASWLILAVVVLRLVLKKAPKWVNCVLWALVAVRLICPFSFESNLSLVPDVELAEMPMSQTAAGADIEIDETTGKIEFMESLPVYDPTIETGNNTGNMRNDSVPQTSGQKWAVVDIVAAAWLAGMVILLLYAAISYLRLRRKVSAAMPLRENIWLCDGVKSPFILGILRPRIYLPSAISEENMEHVLAHERAHLQRRDHWWKPVGFVLLAVYWFNPLVWAAYILLCRDIELACDEKVIKSPNIDRKGYSEALLNCSVKRTAITACPLAFGEVSVRGRIKSVLNYKKPAFWIIIAALVACIVLAVCFLTDPMKPTKEEVMEQNGYGITKIATDVAMMVNIPLDALPDDLYSYTIQDPYVYEKGEVVLWQSDTTTLWLESVGYEERKNDVVFDCEFSYEILDTGIIRTMSYPEIKDGITISYHCTDGIGSRGVFDSNTLYSDAAYLRGSNWDLQFCMAVDADVVQQASGYIAFRVWKLNEISYAKGQANHENDIEMRVSNEYDPFSEESRQKGLEHGRAIASQFENVPSGYWAYYNSEIGDAIGSYDYILVRKQLDLSNGDKVPTYFLSPDRKTLVAVKQDKDENIYSWTFVKNEAGEWVVSKSQTKLSGQSISTTGNAEGPTDVTVEPEWGDSFSFQGLMCGEELVYPSPITFTGEDSWFRYSLTYTRPTVDLELGLRYEDGTEFILENVTGGRSNEKEDEIPEGICRLFIRNVTGDALHPPLSAVELGVITFTSTGAFEELNGTFEDGSTRLHHAIEVAVEKHCALATPDDRAYLVTHHNYLLDKEADGETLIAYIVTMSNTYLCELGTDQQPVQFNSVERAAVLTFSIGEDGSYNLDEFRILRDDAAVQSEFPPKAAREAADSIYSLWLDDECDNKALQSCRNAANGQENVTARAEDASIGVAMIDAVEELLAGKLPATICKMDETGHVHPVFGKLNAWDSINGKNSCRAILDHTYQEVDSLETSDGLITLEFTVNGVDWGLTFYDGTDSLSVWTGGAEYYFKAIPNYEDIFLSPLGSLIRRWYDEAEYMAMDGYDGKTIVIPNTGQSYLEAAQAWCEAYESLHLMASPGSKECYSYVSCRVVSAEGATSMYREQGEIGENTYAFRVHTAFVPENEQALQWHMAGNTGDYEGNDPNVPQEALEYMQCGYITLEEDGWHGTIVGTGF